MSMSLLEIIESAGYNPRNPDDAIRLAAILNDDDIEHLNEIIENTIDLDHNRQRARELQEQLKSMKRSNNPFSEYQVLLEDLHNYQDTIDELVKEGDKL
jgi:hypothetical protein